MQNTTGMPEIYKISDKKFIIHIPCIPNSSITQPFNKTVQAGKVLHVPFVPREGLPPGKEIIYFRAVHILRVPNQFRNEMIRLSKRLGFTYNLCSRASIVSQEQNYNAQYTSRENETIRLTKLTRPIFFFLLTYTFSAWLLSRGKNCLWGTNYRLQYNPKKLLRPH